MTGDGSFDLLPAPTSRVRRQRRWVRPIILALVVFGGIVILLVFAIGRGENQAPRVLKRPTGRTRPTGGASTRRNASASTTTRPGSAVAPSPGTQSPSSSLTAPGPEGTSPSTASPEDIQSGISLTTTTCEWDAQNAVLHSAGTLTNTNQEGHTVQVSVTWFNPDGTQINGAGDGFYVDAGGDPVDWQLTNGVDAAPSGAPRCDVSIAGIS